MKDTFTKYTDADLSNTTIPELAKQYNGIDMWALHGMSEDMFPFVINTGSTQRVMFWCKTNGIVASEISDPVFMYAFAVWLEEHVHPVFHSIEEAQNWAEDHDWVRI